MRDESNYIRWHWVITSPAEWRKVFRAPPSLIIAGSYLLLPVASVHNSRAPEWGRQPRLLVMVKCETFRRRCFVSRMCLYVKVETCYVSLRVTAPLRYLAVITEARVTSGTPHLTFLRHPKHSFCLHHQLLRRESILGKESYVSLCWLSYERQLWKCWNLFAHF